MRRHRPKMQILTCLFVVRILQGASSSTEPLEGAPCSSSDGSTGVCTRVSKCPAVRDDIRYRRLPFLVMCRFEIKDPIVCCSKTRDVQSMKKVCEASILSDSVPKRDKAKPKRYATIRGGSRVVAREFPHMAAVGFVKRGRKLWLCGGTLIHKRFVLTAAHCLEDSSIYRYGKARFVRLGDVDLKNSADDVDVQEFSVVRRIPHPDYRAPQKYHDIALLELDSDVYFDSSVSPACLHSQDTLPDETLIASGWGRTEPGRNLTGQKLMKVDLDLQPMQKCMDVIAEKVDPQFIKMELRVGLRDDSMLCAGVLKGGKDSCQGDSGGPLQVRAHSPTCDFDVVGIISFGIECAQPDTPAVYTRVSNYVPWIESVVCA